MEKTSETLFFALLDQDASCDHREKLNLVN
jgi:hypothetical protein